MIERMFDTPRAAILAISDQAAAQRKQHAALVELHGELEYSGVYREDAHSSAKTMMRHVAKLSPSQAAAVERGSRMVRTLPEVGAALAAGELGVAQFDLLGRVHGNPRVRVHMVDAQEWFLDKAGQLSFADFEVAVREWERLADMDGAAQANQRAHENRNARLDQNRFDLSWDLSGSFAALQGASMREIFAHYVAAERLADWEKARAERGEEATDADLPRTEPQRRADALWQVFQDAAAADGSAVPPDFCHDIVWSAEAYEEMLRRLDGQPALNLGADEYRCETINGTPLEPTEAAAASLVHRMRRVVVDAAGVVIDLGRARRFTGSARKAVQLSTAHCPWPGCNVPATLCEIDHTVDHARGGRTDPGNGGPFCGRHNRWKQKRFTVWRDPTGEWHVYRPDGSEIE